MVAVLQLHLLWCLVNYFFVILLFDIISLIVIIFTNTYIYIYIFIIYISFCFLLKVWPDCNMNEGRCATVTSIVVPCDVDEEIWIQSGPSQKTILSSGAPDRETHFSGFLIHTL